MERSILEVELENAYELHCENPETFDYPSTEEICSLRVGDGIKVCNGDERFWVVIVEIDEDKYICEVSNRLLDPPGYDLGDYIYVLKENIYQVRKIAERNAIMCDIQETLSNPDHIPKYYETILFLQSMRRC